MIISHSNKWIYFAAPKAASSVIQMILQDYDEQDIEVDNHITYSDLKKVLYKQNIDIDNYFKFTFVRNPWDKIVSFYHYARENGDIGSGVTFSWFVHNLDLWLWPGCCYISMISEGEENKMDYIGRVETLRQDVCQVCDLLNIQKPRPWKTKTRANKSTHDHYSSYYDDDLKNIVADRYNDEIEMFGYKFLST